MPDDPSLSAETAPKQTNRNIKLYLGLGLLLVVVIGAVLITVLASHGKKSTSTTASEATYSKTYKSDILFGNNRSVNACNVLPESLVTAQFGAISAFNQNAVNEAVIESNVPAAQIDPTDGNDTVSTCLRSLDDGGSIHLAYDGYRDIESAQAGYNNYIAHTQKIKGYTITTVPGMHASTITYKDHLVDVRGAHDNFVYNLEVESGVQPGAASNDVLSAKAIALAKQIEVNMDTASVSTHPATIPTVSSVGGISQIDPCQLFDAKTFEQALLARSTVLPKLKLPKTAYSADVGRQYNNDGSAGIENCSRSSAPANYKDRTLADALKNAFTGGVENTSVTVSGFSNPADAQHNVDVLSDTAAVQVPGIGDKATYGQGGFEANIKQLVFSKGTYSIAITANYGDGSGTNEVPEADFVSLAKALAVKLP